MPLISKVRPLPSPSKAELGASTAERSLHILAIVAKAGSAISLAEISSQLGLPKATTHRLCNQLLGIGFLARDQEERFFAVGASLRTLAFDTLNHDSVRGLRHAVLTELVETIGETCNYTTLDGASVLYLDRVEAPWPWRLTLDIGSHVPLHCTASGKLFLALMPENNRQALLPHLALNQLTSNTITSEKKLRAECALIAQQGYALDREEFVVGLVALAVPVYSKEKVIRATIAVHAPSSRLSVGGALALLKPLQAAAKRMAKLL
jgi:IclR family transcriptional regulator, acetate operon repressor